MTSVWPRHVLGATYDILDDAATVAGAITAGNAEVNGAASITTNGGAVDLSFDGRGLAIERQRDCACADWIGRGRRDCD